MIRQHLRKFLGLSMAFTFIASLWTLSQSPFAAPYRARTEAEISVALDRALWREMSSAVVEQKIAGALDTGAADEASAILRLADVRGVEVSEEMRVAVLAAEEAATGWSACLACAISTEECPDLTRVAACNLPVELTPVGDAKSITRALLAYVQGEEIDRIDLSLGVVGLGSTVAILASGGSSASVKVGATALRVARRSGAVSASLMRELTGLARASLRMDRARDVLRGTAKPSALIDGVPARKLTEAASSMGQITTVLPAGDALAILRYADNTDDLARLARVAQVAGTETRGAFAVLGSARAMRLTHRLAEMTLLAIALVAAILGQILTLVLWMLRRGLRTSA